MIKIHMYKKGVHLSPPLAGLRVEPPSGAFKLLEPDC